MTAEAVLSSLFLAAEKDSCIAISSAVKCQGSMVFCNWNEVPSVSYINHPFPSLMQSLDRFICFSSSSQPSPTSTRAPSIALLPSLTVHDDLAKFLVGGHLYRHESSFTAPSTRVSGSCRMSRLPRIRRATPQHITFRIQRQVCWP